MENPHIIVGGPRRCICGIYEINGVRKSVSCLDVLRQLENQERAATTEGVALTVIKTLVRDCA